MRLLKDNSLFYLARLVYICFTVVYMAARMVAPLNFLIESVWVSLSVFLFGFLIVVYDLFTEQRCLKSKGIDFLGLFVVVCIISSVVNLKYGVGGNIKAVGALILQFFLFYSVGVGASAEQKKKELRAAMATLCVVWGAFVFFSLQMYFFDIEYILSGGSWGKVSHGFSAEYQRLWGVFTDPNYASFISVISIFASIYLMVETKRIATYVLGTISALLQLSYLVLAASRAATILFCAASFFVLLYWFVISASKAKERLAGFGLSVLISAAIVCVIVSIQYALPFCKLTINKIDSSISNSVTTLYNSVYEITGVEVLEIPQKPSDTLQNPDTDVDSTNSVDSASKDEVSSGASSNEISSESVSSEVTSSESVSSDATSSESVSSEATSSESVSSDATSSEPVSSESVSSEIVGNAGNDSFSPINRTDTDKEDISNGRFKRWIQTVDIFKKAPILGTSPRNVSAFAKDHAPESLMALYGIAPHNGYLDVLVGTGIVGTLIMVAYLIMCVVIVLKKCFTKFRDPILAVSAASVFALAGSAMVLSDIFMFFTFGSVMFFMMMGYAVNDENDEQGRSVLYTVFCKVFQFFKKLGKN